MRKPSLLVGNISRSLFACVLAGLTGLLPTGVFASSSTLAGPGKTALVVTQSLPQLSQMLSQADVVILGEVHDNAEHHRIQAQLVESLKPSAIVWEMITQEQAASLTPDILREPQQTADILQWETSGWPDFALYAPVFRAASQIPHFGALVPRAASQAALKTGVASHFGADAARFGLDQKLPQAEQALREADQMANHCNAMPVEMLSLLVDFQRLRDTSLAAAAERALRQTGGPVVVITGNGHARNDRGLPVYLRKADPHLHVLSLGQMEEGRIEGVFDLYTSSPAVLRPDPCLEFSKSE